MSHRPDKIRPPKATPHPTVPSHPWLAKGICIGLAALVWVVFGRTLHYSFTNFDDGPYVYENPEVVPGLTGHGIIWAFTHVWSFNWHPLTWISHMLDCQFYGLDAGNHHLTNLLLHTAVTILLFLVLWRMTNVLWRSAFVAAVFAIHPLHVESVAWVAERKDVLSGIFFILTIGAYVRYTRQPWSPARYGLVVLWFALGLMCKPMLVTLPFILLLLDYWPLNRLDDWRASKPVLLEKLPLFGLAIASSVITIFAQHDAVRSLDQIPLPLRIENALVSYATYLGQMFWPFNLAVLYPFPFGGWPIWAVILAISLLIFISSIAFAFRKTRPYLLVGWLWYLVMLLPVVGIIQIGSQAHADRYTYLPQIGLCVMFAWALADICAGWRYRHRVLGSFAVTILATLTLCARLQTSHWQNSETLWNHTLACTSNNFIARNNLGTALFQKGNTEAAIDQYRQALKIRPGYADAHGNLGAALLQAGNLDEAMTECREALKTNPDNAEAHNNLGNALLQKGDIDEAMTHCQAALQIKPSVEAYNNLAYALLQKGKTGEAIAHYQKAAELARAAGHLDVVERLENQIKSLRNGISAP